MLCAKPFRSPAGEFGCGQCMPCRINKRRQWTARIVLESGLHAGSVFATLTYEDPAPWSVSPRELQLFMKRLRFSYPGPLRFFGVGEYGDKTFRPHYHLALFGISILDAGYVDKAWGHGFVHVGDLTTQSAAYIAGYVCKKMTAADDPRLEGRHPEFARMSLRPGIGRRAMTGVASHLVSNGGSAALVKSGDVPGAARVDGKLMPIGRYLKGALRQEVGWQEGTPLGVAIATKVASVDMPDGERWARERKRAHGERSAQARNKISRSKNYL